MLVIENFWVADMNTVNVAPVSVPRLGLNLFKFPLSLISVKLSIIGRPNSEVMDAAWTVPGIKAAPTDNVNVVVIMRGRMNVTNEP